MKIKRRGEIVIELTGYEAEELKSFFESAKWCNYHGSDDLINDMTEKLAEALDG